MMFRPGLPKDRRELPDRFRFGEVEVDVAGMRVWRGGEAVGLEPKAFDVLLLLAANPGRVVSKDELIERVWADAGVSDNALTRVIAQLRRELGDDVGDARYVMTVRTRGYRFLPEVEAAAPAAPGPTAVAASAAVEAPPEERVRAPEPAGTGVVRAGPPGGRRLAVRLAAGAAIALAGLAAVWVLRGGMGRPDPAFAVSGAPVQLTTAPGYDGQPSFSPDGSEIVYVSERASGLDLVVRSLDGGGEGTITFGEAASEPAWSPDGRWIAYHSMRRGGIWLIPPRGGEPRRVTEFGAQPAWSPDSRRLVFRSQEGHDLSPGSWAGSIDSVLWIADVEAGTVEQITRPGSTRGGHGMPAWSPDGRTIVFASGEASATALHRIPASGGTPAPLVAEAGAALAPSGPWTNPVFTPDGRSVLALRTGRSYAIVRVDIRSGAVEAVLPIAPSGMNNFTLSADGRRLAWTVAEIDSAIVEAPVAADGRRAGAARTLVQGGRQRVSMPSYSPGGERLLYSRRRAGAIPDIELLDRGTLLSRPFVAEGYGARWLSPDEAVVWAPAPRAIEVAGGRRRDVPAGPEARAVMARHSATSSSWSPDLRRLAFAGRVGNAIEIFTWTPEEPEARQVTRLGSLAHYPAWSRDSSTLAFQLVGVDGSRSEQLWVVGVDGAGARAVTSALGRSWSVTFSPDGQRLGYAAQRGGRWDIGTVEIATGAESLFDVNDSWTTFLRWLDWSPRGDAIAFERTRVVGDVWVLSLPEA